MIHEIQAKTLLSHVKQPDPWFGLRYNMNLYRGCQHQCIYCDSRSACYGIANFRDVLVKTNAIARLHDELPRKREKGTIGTGSMNDPYMPLEAQYTLTRRALEVIAHYGFPVHVLTKSDLVLRDLDHLRAINAVHAVVSFTIITTDDDLAAKLEPGAPPPSRRLAALRTLAEAGIHTGILLMPVLPYLTDTPRTISAVVKAAAAHGAEFVVPAFGMTLRDRQRAYYYRQLDRLYPGARARYERRFGEQYYCAARNAGWLEQQFHMQCDGYGLATEVSRYTPPEQLPLFG